MVSEVMHGAGASILSCLVALKEPANMKGAARPGVSLVTCMKPEQRTVT